MMKKFAFLMVFLFSLSTLFAQERTITGKVVDETGSPLLGATVSLKGTTKGVVTDVNGAYSISVPISGGSLVVSYVGYLSNEIAVAESNVIEFNMVPDITSLEQVVVVGYGVQKKSLVTGSIAKVDSKDIANTTATRFEQAIQGKTSGMVVAQNSGAPGSGLTIKIRGNSSDRTNSPLIIVDGVRTGGLEYLNPADIESIEVLKDAASAAIYGAEGGNGVIIVSTKKGKKGSSQVEYRFAHSNQQATKLPEAMTGPQYRKYFMEAANLEKNTKAYSDFAKLDSLKGTNWVDEIFQTAPMDEHTLNFSGGSDKTSYYLSASYLDQDGIIGGDKNNFTRYSFRSNIESDVKSWLTVGSNISYTRFSKKNLNATNEYGGIINNALNYDPTIGVYTDTASILPKYKADKEVMGAWNRDAQGRYFSKSPITDGEAWNPVAQIDYTDDVTTQDKVVGDLHADFKPFSGFKLTSRLLLDYAYQKNDKFTGKNFYGVDPLKADTNTFVEQSWDRWYKYGIENFATFNKQFGDHGVELMLGQSYENYAHYWLYVKAFNIPYQSIDFAFPGAALDTKRFEMGDQTDDPQATTQASYFGRAIYNYKEKYMLQGNFRRDGASNFGPDKKWGFFPSFSAGWTVSKEDFFANSTSLEFINSLKLRGSWGQNGSRQSLSSFPYVSTMQLIYYSDASTTGSRTLAKVPGTPANTGLKWETSEQLDFGTDFGFLKNSLTLSIDWFKKSTIDQLAEKSDMPIYLGFQGNPMINSGEIENRGWEFDISYRNKVGDFNYSASFNASYIKNKVVDYGIKQGKDGNNVGQLGVVNRYDIGQPVWYFYGLKAIGIFQDQPEIDKYLNSKGEKIQPKAKPGDVKFADLPVDSLGGVGNGVIDGNDRQYLGKPMPDWTYGLNLSCEYKGFDLSLFFQGVTGNQVFWAGYRMDRTKYNKASMWFDKRWTGPNTSDKYPRATLTDANGNFRISSLNVYDGDYLRLKNLSFGYTLPSTLTNKVFISKLRIYYTGTNLLTFTNYPGTDPEVGMFDAYNNTTLGVDKGLYPPTRVHTFGVSVTF